MSASNPKAANGPLRVVLFSSTFFGRQCLERAILPSSAAQTVGIVTTDNMIEINYSDAPISIASHARFDDLAKEHGISLANLGRRPRIKDMQRLIDAWKPDVILVLGWYFLVPDRLRRAAPRGCLGIHGSLLPRYRGGAPIPWAIIQGEQETGATLFHLTDAVDAGAIVGQAPVRIEDEDTVAEVYNKVITASIRLISDALPMLATGDAPAIPQNEADASHFPQRSPADGQIDWSWDARRIHDFVRAQTHPYPGAFSFMSSLPVKVWRTRPCTTQTTTDPPGTILIADGTSFRVACGENTVVELLDIDAPNLKPGTRFT